MKLSETVGELIHLGDASRAYWDKELPKRHPRYPVIREDEGSVPAPPEDAKIRALLERLPESQLYTLVLLAHLGRGDFGAADLQHAYQDVRGIFSSRELAIAQLTENTALAEYLADAMDEIGKLHIDVDNLNFVSPVVAS